MLPRFKILGCIGGVSLAACVSGCTTLGTNVSGSFRCEAPDGQCAPSMTIDDQALSEITRAEATDFLSPAGPYKVDDGDGVKTHMAAVQAGGEPLPNQRYQLSVVFPAYTDAAGVMHDRKAVATDVGLPGRSASSVELANRARGNSTAVGLLSAAEAAPELLSHVRQRVPGAPVAQGASVPPGGSPVERIRDEVDEKLSQHARRQAASFPPQE